MLTDCLLNFLFTVCVLIWHDVFSLYITHSEGEEQAIMQEAKELGKNMDLNIVRLKFTAYLQDSNGSFTRALKPAVSNPIYDSSKSCRKT